MNEKTKGYLKDILVLVLIAAVSGLLLGLFNQITYVDPKVEAMKRFDELYETEGGFTLVAEKPTKEIRYVAKAADGTVALLASGKGGYKGEVQAYVFFKEGKPFLLSIGENGETYVNKLEEAHYPEALCRAADPEKVDAVSGATRSSRAVKDAFMKALDYYGAHFEGGEYVG